MTQLSDHIEHIKRTLRYHHVIFENQLHECRLFSAGTCERIMEERRAEEKEFSRKLDKVKRTIPKRLLKKIEKYEFALTIANRMNTAIASYAWDDPHCDAMQIDDETRDHFISAKQESVRAYHDLAKHLFLQNKISDHTKEMNCHITRVTNLHNYVANIDNLPRRVVLQNAVLQDITDMETSQRRDKYKKIAGITLRIIGWGIIIAASVIGFNPAVGFVIMGLSLAATVVGEALNLGGKKLAKPPISQQQMRVVHDSLLFFKKSPPVIAELTENGSLTNGHTHELSELSLSRSA
jgi:hypothetical protein